MTRAYGRVCVPPQVLSADDSSSAGHRGVSGNSEPLPGGRRCRIRRRKVREMLSSWDQRLPLSITTTAPPQLTVWWERLTCLLVGSGGVKRIHC